MRILKYLIAASALMMLLGATVLSQLTVALTNIDLSLTPASPNLVVPIVRFGFTSVGDAPPLWWWRQSGTCVSNSMVSDGGSCQNASDGNSFYSINSGFADPRQFGATCGSGAGAATWFQNNATNDDAPGFNAALATGLPVVIPSPGCKWVTQVAAPAAGATILSFGGAGAYDALTGSTPAITFPYINVPTAAASNATNNCIFDTKGYDGVSWRYVTIIGVSETNGTSAFCNSVGIANGRPQAFASLDHVSITNMAGIGTATTSTCQVTGSLSTPVMQMTIQSLRMGHDCFGIYANYSDNHLTDILMGNIFNACIASPAGGGIAMEITNLRCEYTGHFDANPIFEDGAAVYISTAGFFHLTNAIFDHTFGACLVWDGNNGGQSAGWSSASNVLCKDSGTGGAVAGGGVINNPCSYIFENQAENITANNMAAQSFTIQQPYTLCFRGTAGYGITWWQNDADGPNSGGGWSTAYINGTVPSGSSIYAPGYGSSINFLPTSCSGQPTGALANVSGTVHSC